MAGNSTTDAAAKTFSLLDDVTWVKGKHILKTGFEIRWIELNQGSSQSGSLTYTSMALFAANHEHNATYVSTLPLKRSRKAQYWVYIQDEYKVTPNLTLNLGLRYNFFNIFHEVDNRAIPFDFASCGPGGYCPRGSNFGFPRYNDIDPRVSVAWATARQSCAPAGACTIATGRRTIRISFRISNDYLRYSLTAAGSPGLSFPIDSFLSATSGVGSPRLLDRNRKDMYASVDGFTAADLAGQHRGHWQRSLIREQIFYHELCECEGSSHWPGALSRLRCDRRRGNTSNSTFHALQFNTRRLFQRAASFC